MNVLLVHAFYNLILAGGFYGLSYVVERPIREGIGPVTALATVALCRAMGVILGVLSVLLVLLYLFW